jgi:hypothetical protein
MLLLAIPLIAAGMLGSAGNDHATLRVLDRQPLVVRGQGFKPGERVTVTALTGLGPRVVRTTAVRGAFRVELRLPAQPCAAAFAVRARGNRGSEALRTFDGRPCVPPPRD